MSFSVTTAFVQQFSGAIRSIGQQMDSRLERTVIKDNIRGDRSYMEQIAPTAAQKVFARHSDTPMMNTQHLRRRIAPYDYDWADIIDEEDTVRLLIDPESAYTQNAGYAMNRGKDDEIIGAFFATAFTGVSGSTSVVWPNADAESAPSQPAGTQVSVSDWTYGNGSGNTGLTISKLVSAMVALDAAEGDENEERYLIIGAKQKGNLLATTEATLKEFGVAKDDLAPMRDGKLAMILGFEVIRSQRLLLNASSQTRVPAYRKSAMGLGIAKDITTQMERDPGKRYSWRPFATMSIGASRLEEQKLVELVCL